MAASPEAVKRFIRSLTTTSGRYAGKPFNLYPFQEDLIDLIFERDEEKNRIRREVVIGMARKNGKSELMAAVGLALLVVDREPGGLVIIAAAKRDQAKLILNVAKRMVWNSSVGGRPLSDFIQVKRDYLYFPELDAELKVIAADAQKEHGLNPHAFIIDEGHATMEKSRELYDTLLTAQGARDNPLAITITTAGPRPAGPMYDLYRYGKEIEAGIRTDPEFGFRWWEAPPDAEIGDIEAQKAANPAWGLFLRQKFLDAAATAVHNGKAPEFQHRRLHYNNWTTASERWLPYTKLDAAAGKSPHIPEGGDVWIALDAALSRDTFAVAIVHVSEEAAEVAEDADPRTEKVAHCVVRRFKPEHEGGYIDPAEVLTYLLGIAAQHHVLRVSYDPAYMGMLVGEGRDRGLPMEPFPQSAQKMEKATETFQRVFLDERARIGRDPVLIEQIASIATKPTERGVRITKLNSMPVDMAVALAMALDDALGDEEIDGPDFARMIL